MAVYGDFVVFENLDEEERRRTEASKVTDKKIVCGGLRLWLTIGRSLTARPLCSLDMQLLGMFRQVNESVMQKEMVRRK